MDSGERGIDMGDVRKPAFGLISFRNERPSEQLASFLLEMGIMGIMGSPDHARPRQFGCK